MSYALVVEKDALLDFEKIKKSGDKASLKKLRQILDELEINPYEGTGNPEQLKHELLVF